jgi:hypothetical protein
VKLDDVARRASRELREVESAETAPDFGEFQHLATSRRRARIALAAATLAVLLGVVTGATQWLDTGSSRRSGEPAQQASPTPPQETTAAVDEIGCLHPRITCGIGQQLYGVDLDVDLTWKLVHNFGAPYSGGGPTATFVESYLAGREAGVSVFEQVQVAAQQRSPRALADIRTAQEFITWVSERPYLQASSVRRTTLSGQRAWTVDVRVPHDTPAGPGRCTSHIACHPVIYQFAEGNPWIAGLWGGMTARYTAIDLDGAGITVVWSWSFEGDIPWESDEMVDTIRFG